MQVFGRSLNEGVAAQFSECFTTDLPGVSFGDHMPDHIKKLKDNVPGKYYVGAECIGCSLCSEVAPNNFASDWNENLETEHNYVCKQPENAQEEELCAEAAETCPANAIHEHLSV